MTISKIYCDRCKAEIDPNSIYYTCGSLEHTYGATYTEKDFNELDLCEKCGNELVEWVKEGSNDTEND